LSDAVFYTLNSTKNRLSPGFLQRSCRPSSCFAADNGEGMKEREGGERRKERDISRTKILAIWPWQCSIL